MTIFTFILIVVNIKCVDKRTLIEDTDERMDYVTFFFQMGLFYG